MLRVFLAPGAGTKKIVHMLRVFLGPAAKMGNCEHVTCFFWRRAPKKSHMLRVFLALDAK